MTERITISGICLAVTDKAILLETQEADRWCALKHTIVLGGTPAKGAILELSIPVWLYRKQSESPLDRKARSTVIPPDVMRRLIQLCHPDKHGGSDAATKATAWLLANR